MEKIFKLEVTFKIKGNLSTEQFKQYMMRKIDDFTLYNEEDEEVQIDTLDYWNTAKVIEI